MPLNRREALLAAITATFAGSRTAMTQADDDPLTPIIDTHQHLWDRSAQRLLWLDGAPDVLRHDFSEADYRDAARGTGIDREIYMEVDVDPTQHVAEADRVLALCRDPTNPTVAAVIGGRPSSPDFATYLDRFRDEPAVKGVRQVLHGPSTPPGFCLADDFVRGIRLLGDRGLLFDLCLRPAELSDGATLARRCPNSSFILDHCGNADPSAFFDRPADSAPGHDADSWRRAIDDLATLPNVSCKISGIVARVRSGWVPDDLAPIVDHCLDAFGPNRVVFGGDWPVCLTGSPLADWVAAIRFIVARRPATDRLKLFSANADRLYSLAPAAGFGRNHR